MVAATGKGWPLELPTGQEPGVALELGTDSGQGHLPVEGTILGPDNATVATHSLSVSCPFPAGSSCLGNQHLSFLFRNTYPWSILWSQVQTMLDSEVLFTALSTGQDGSWAEAAAGVSAKYQLGLNWQEVGMAESSWALGRRWEGGPSGRQADPNSVGRGSEAARWGSSERRWMSRWGRT